MEREEGGRWEREREASALAAPAARREEREESSEAMRAARAVSAGDGLYLYVDVKVKKGSRGIKGE